MADNKVLSALVGALDLPYLARYGVPAAEKERLALSGKAPGAESRSGPSSERDIALANRAAAVYLGSKRWGPAAQGFNYIREALKGVFGSGYDQEMIDIGNKAAQTAYSEKVGRGLQREMIEKKKIHDTNVKNFIGREILAEMQQKTDPTYGTDS